jgi:hypothetical protein
LYIARSSRVLADGVVEVTMLAARLLAAVLFPSAGGGPRSTTAKCVSSRCSAVFGSG